MNCEQVQQWIHPYVDGELSRPKARAIQKHINTCSECMDRVIDDHSLAESLNMYDLPESPEGFTRDVMSQVRNHASHDRLLTYGRTLGLVATLLVGVFLGATMALDVTRTMEQNGVQGVGSSRVQANSVSESQPVDYQSETFSEISDDSLSDRFVRVESASSGENAMSP